MIEYHTTDEEIDTMMQALADYLAWEKEQEVESVKGNYKFRGA